MQFIIGIDGGGSKTRCVAADLTGKPLLSLEGGAVNRLSAGTNAASDSLAKLINAALRQLDTAPGDCASLCLGAAGAGRDEERKTWFEFLRAYGFEGKLLVTDDAKTALYGAFSGKPGCVLISGTGSIAYGLSRSGEFSRCGGWGHILGDEGSGYDIGRLVLNAVTKGLDGRAGETLLTRLVFDHLGIRTGAELIQFAYAEKTGKKEIAALSILADTACEKGDKTAKTILTCAAEALFLCAATVISRLELSEQRLAFSGSVLEKSAPLSRLVRSRIEAAYPKLALVEKEADAARGAVLLAQKNLTEFRRLPY